MSAKQLSFFQTVDNMLRASYPETPGHRNTDTSIRAAIDITEHASTLRDQCLDHLIAQPATADEIAKAMNESVLSIRPRITELNKRGLIVDTGARRRNESGKSAIVWTVKRSGER